ncbi:MAG TPA: cytochrome c family protein [Rhizomicrobium sp.]|nr:cytochrome c family protein [Rhizomicrobium sp.]
MDSFEWNKIIGAVLGTAIFIFVVRLVAEKVYEPEKPAKPGYTVEGVVEASAGGGAAAPVEETMPDWGTVLASADVAAGKATSTKCEQCHDTSSAKTTKIGPPLFGVVDRARASIAGFAYSSAMKGKPGNWTYDELFKFIKAPGVDIPGTKMSFAGLRNEKDRINLIAFLRSNADSQAPIPAPAPKAAAAPAAAAPAAAAPAAPAKGPNGPAAAAAPKPN